jgi:hypothetical protein
MPDTVLEDKLVAVNGSSSSVSPVEASLKEHEGHRATEYSTIGARFVEAPCSWRQEMAHGADAPRRRSDQDRSVTGRDNKKSVWQALRSELLKEQGRQAQ